jgi:hypothetical protein
LVSQLFVPGHPEPSDFQVLTSLDMVGLNLECGPKVLFSRIDELLQFSQSIRF